jgi:hypothetical protein
LRERCACISAEEEVAVFRTDRRLFSAALLAALFLVPRSVSADVIQIPVTAFSGTESLVQFTVSSSQPLPYSEDGANFLGYTGFFAGLIGGNAFLSLSGPGTLTVTFDEPVTMAGFRFINSFSPAGVRAAVFGDVAGVQPVGQVIFPGFGALESGFVGWFADAPFSRAEISFGVPSPLASFVMDDFRFDNSQPVPEPGTIALTLGGLTLLARRMRRRTTTR